MANTLYLSPKPFAGLQLCPSAHLDSQCLNPHELHLGRCGALVFKPFCCPSPALPDQGWALHRTQVSSAPGKGPLCGHNC